MRISATVLGAPDPQALGAFYARLLGSTVVKNEPVWVMVRPPSGGTGLTFQHEPVYVPPVWPPWASRAICAHDGHDADVAASKIRRSWSRHARQKQPSAGVICTDMACIGC